MTLSVCCITYNQEKYIAQAIEGMLIQHTNFPFEIVIGEDGSSDNTRKICEMYHAKNPGKINLLPAEGNLGMIPNLLKTLKACKGEYIAICEGDDYWIDSFKLQKQVDFLKASPEYAICFSGYKILNQITGQETVINNKVQPISIEEIIKTNSFSTATVTFISKHLYPPPFWFTNLPFGDWAIYLTVLFNSEKKAYRLEDITAVYRIHSEGIHGSLHESNIKLVKAYKMHIDFYRQIQTHLFEKKYSQLIKACIRERKKIIAKLLIKENKFFAAVRSYWY